MICNIKLLIDDMILGNYTSYVNVGLHNNFIPQMAVARYTQLYRQVTEV